MGSSALPGPALVWAQAAVRRSGMQPGADYGDWQAFWSQAGRPAVSLRRQSRQTPRLADSGWSANNEDRTVAGVRAAPGRVGCGSAGGCMPAGSEGLSPAKSSRWLRVKADVQRWSSAAAEGSPLQWPDSRISRRTPLKLPSHATLPLQFRGSRLPQFRLSEFSRIPPGT